MTTLIRWNPIREMSAMQSAMDRLFDETWRGVRGSEGGLLALDVIETDAAYTLRANLPGVDADAINVNLHEGVLTIGAEIKREEAAEGTRLLVQERAAGRYQRSITLPQPVDADSVEAAYEDGVLLLTLPKVPEVQPRQIPVRVSRS